MTTTLAPCLPCVLWQKSMALKWVVTFYILWSSWGRSKSFKAKVKHTFNLRSIHQFSHRYVHKIKLQHVTLTTSGTKVCRWKSLSPTIWTKHLGTQGTWRSHIGFNPNSLCAHSSVQDPWIQHLCLVSILVLPWAFWFCRELFGFAVRNLLLPWQLWATVVHKQNSPEYL